LAASPLVALGSCRAVAGSALGNEHIQRDVELAMKGADHREREVPPPVEDLGDARSRAKDRLEVLARPSLLLETKQDRLDGIGRQDGGMGALVGIDESAEDVELVELGATRLGVP
jgi:hypothetical protein